MSARLAIVTATLDLDRAKDCVSSWAVLATGPLDIYIVGQTGAGMRDWELVADTDCGPQVRFFAMSTREVLGVVPAFALGVQKALEDGAPLIACLHDDLLIEQQTWDEDVVRLFKACPRAGLCGFGGGKGLGSDDIYRTPYNPMQLARIGFISNMRDAEAHGERVEVAMPVACLDGFSQIGTRTFWQNLPHFTFHGTRLDMDAHPPTNLFAQMQQLGMVHHFYDAALGAFAKRLGYQVWFLPIRCHHYGGRTAVGNQRYTDWALGQVAGGDGGFWEAAHRIGYTEFKDVLPIRT